METHTISIEAETVRDLSFREVFTYFLTLGFVNIGGPVAQITMMYNQMVERRQWLTKDRFVRIMGFCHILPGPEALQLAIYVGYLKQGLLGGIVAGLTFILPGALIMIALSWLYVTYGSLPQVNAVMYILKPAVLGIIAAGLIKIGRASIKNRTLGALLVVALVLMRFTPLDPLLIMLLIGGLHLLWVKGVPHLQRAPTMTLTVFPLLVGGALALDDRVWQMIWLFLKTGAFSFGGAYASLAFLQRGAVGEYGWLTTGQLLDGVALSVATPGPLMLFATFVGYMAGGVTGALIATVFVFLPSFVFILVGARYIEPVQSNRYLQAFLAGVSAAVVAVILIVSLDLVPAALVDAPSILLALAAFLLIVWRKTDTALVAGGAMVVGVLYAVIQSLLT
ncbi:MAG: chromate efflux transporter [Chloroflexota bacterium]